jgi:iron complex outermembrane receptor protein
MRSMSTQAMASGFRSGGFNAIGTEDLLNFWFNAGFGGPGEVVDAQLT